MTNRIETLRSHVESWERSTPDYRGRTLRLLARLSDGDVPPDTSEERGLDKILRSNEVPQDRVPVVREVLTLVRGEDAVPAEIPEPADFATRIEHSHPTPGASRQGGAA
jgi:hypothetical protein